MNNKLLSQDFNEKTGEKKNTKNTKSTKKQVDDYVSDFFNKEDSKSTKLTDSKTFTEDSKSTDTKILTEDSKMEAVPDSKADVEQVQANDNDPLNENDQLKNRVLELLDAYDDLAVKIRTILRRYDFKYVIF